MGVLQASEPSHLSLCSLSDEQQSGIMQRGAQHYYGFRDQCDHRLLQSPRTIEDVEQGNVILSGAGFRLQLPHVSQPSRTSRRSVLSSGS